MEDSQASRSTSSYTARLDRTLKTLQERLKEQEAVLEKLRASVAPIESQPSEDQTTQLYQLRSLKATFESMINEEPWFPPRDSQLPSLLALRATDQTIRETQEAIAKTEDSFQKVNKRLEKEKVDLDDSKLIQSEMQARISSLQVDIEKRTQRSSEQIARDMIREMQKKKTQYDSETGRLVKAFNRFIDDYLGSMLAVEELGGPIVGDILDIDEAMLESGFNTQGKLKKAKPNQDKRQRRIDEIWGPRPSDDGEVAEPWDERLAAGAEMRELTEQLLNCLVEAGGNGPGAYVELSRESAAARFLVRSKVAQFHPKDARKLRLIDFGGEIDE